MNDLLFLPHRLPYPPNKGDKITSYNMLRFLSQRFRVHLGTFVDADEDWQYESVVREYCADACLVGLSPRAAKLKSLRGLATGTPLTITYYASRELQRWVDRVQSQVAPQSVLIYSGAMARFVADSLPPSGHSVLNLEDVDSQKWRAYATQQPWPLSWLYAREGRLLLEFERRMSRRFDITAFISRAEAELYATLAPEAKDKIFFRTQGVDSTFFDPALPHENPYGDGHPTLVFVGAMDYLPNIDGVTWFVNDVLPSIRRERPDTRFFIVGLNPTDEVRRLGKRDGVVVTGAVDDVRPYLAHATVAVMPLRIARGIQNKVLEALAMARPVVATPNAMTGIETTAEMNVAITDDAADMARQVLTVMDGPGENAAAREMVLGVYNWDRNLELIARLLHGERPKHGSLA